MRIMELSVTFGEFDWGGQPGGGRRRGEGAEWLGVSVERCRRGDWVLTDSCGGNLYLI